uniref:HMG box domain-containing protein n=1 Tax=Daucus carota subsp. sativus TaxID=79200 RepID=A0A175YMF3_DAUCS
MVKKAKNSPAPPSTESQRKMVLRIRPPQKMKQVEDDIVEEPKSRKKPKTAAKKKAAKIDSDKPKKPPTAFFYFLEDFRKGYQEENPNVKSMRDVGKACGEKWKTMTYERTNSTIPLIPIEAICIRVDLEVRNITEDSRGYWLRKYICVDYYLPVDKTSGFWPSLDLNPPPLVNRAREEKVQYYDIATDKRAEFDRAMADYIKRKESGEDTKPKDSDSEYDE